MKFIFLFLISFSFRLLLANTDVIVLKNGSVGISGFKFKDSSLVITKVKKEFPAWEAGIRKGGIITKINNQEFKGDSLSIKLILDNIHGSVGEIVRLEIINKRTSQLDTFNLKLKEDKDVGYFIAPYGNFYYYYEYFDKDRLSKSFNLYIVDTNNNLNINNVIQLDKQGGFQKFSEYNLTIQELKPDGVLDSLGIAIGSRILEINDEELNRPNDIAEQLENSFGQEIELVTLFNGDTLRHWFTVKSYKLGSLFGSIYGLQDETLWIKFALYNQSDKEEQYFMDFWSTGTVEMYSYDKDRIQKVGITGDAIPINDKTIKAFSNVLSFYLKAQEKRIFYLKLSGNIGTFISLDSQGSYLEYESKNRLAQGILFGIMLIIALYNFIMFLFIREKSYVFYILYIFSFGLSAMISYGYANELFWPNRILPTELLYFDWMFLPILVLSYLVFQKLYLRLKIELPLWNKIFNVTSIIILIAPLSFLYSVPIIIQDIFTGILAIAWLGSNVPSLILVKRNKKEPIYILVANFLLLISFLITFLINDDVYLQLGVVSQIIIFSIGLGRKISLNEKEKQKALSEIVVQLEENEQLKDKVNRELEDKVMERTSELEQANTEITTQNEEIISQRDSIFEKKNELAKIHDELEASINYAEKIQRSLLPDEALLKEILSDHFIFFKPRDIVSGDYYWFKKVRNYLVITAADCTGHGVPGAFMSMLGVSFLNEIVSKSRFDTPDQILNRLRDKVKKALKQKGDIGENKDGMDMALCVINLETKELQFSGAYNPLYIVRNGEMIQIKADRQPIAVYIAEKPFTLNNHQLEKGDCLYMFSDGYTDQFGGDNNKKFMTKRFKQMLMDNHGKSFKEQESILDKTFKDWKNGQDQMDDVLVIGLKV